MAEEGVNAQTLFAAIRPLYGRNMEIGSVLTQDGVEKIKLSSRQSEERDVWAMQYFPVRAGHRDYKLSDLARVEKGQIPQEVAKENQQIRIWRNLKKFFPWGILLSQKGRIGLGDRVG